MTSSAPSPMSEPDDLIDICVRKIQNFLPVGGSLSLQVFISLFEKEYPFLVDTLEENRDIVFSKLAGLGTEIQNNSYGVIFLYKPGEDDVLEVQPTDVVFCPISQGEEE